MPTIRRLLPLLALSAAAACSDDDNLPDPTEANIVDTVTVGSLTDTPITTAERLFGGVGRRPHRPDRRFRFRLRYPGRLRNGGTSVILPRAALGIISNGAAEPGVMRRDEAFDDIDAAPSNGYVTEEAVPIALGERLHRPLPGRAAPSACRMYAKVEIIGLEDNSLSTQGPGEQQLRLPRPRARLPRPLTPT